MLDLMDDVSPQSLKIFDSCLSLCLKVCKNEYRHISPKKKQQIWTALVYIDVDNYACVCNIKVTLFKTAFIIL